MFALVPALILISAMRPRKPLRLFLLASMALASACGTEQHQRQNRKQFLRR